MQIISRNRPKTYRIDRLLAREDRARERAKRDLWEAEQIARRLDTSTGLSPRIDKHVDAAGNLMGLQRIYGETDDQYRTRIMEFISSKQAPERNWWVQQPAPMIQPPPPYDWTTTTGTTSWPAHTTIGINTAEPDNWAEMFKQTLIKASNGSY